MNSSDFLADRQSMTFECETGQRQIRPSCGGQNTSAEAMRK